MLLLCFCSILAFSQKVQVRATLDSNSIKVGEQVKLTLTVDYRTDEGEIKIKWPVIGDTLTKPVEVVNKSAIDSTLPNQESDPYSFTLSQTVTLTSFDSGYHAIPPFKFVINDDTTKRFETEALLLQVNTVPVDTSAKAVKDIKLPYDAPVTFKELLPYIIGSFILVLIVILIIWYIRKRKKEQPVYVPKTPPVPPHIVALTQLNELREQKLWQQGKTKAYYIELSDILRIYIENRFYISAMEQTTDDILKSFRTVDIDAEVKGKLKQVLILSDLVKFAKEQPLPNENDLSLENAISFVNQTAPVAETKSQKEEEA